MNRVLLVLALPLVLGSVAGAQPPANTPDPPGGVPSNLPTSDTPVGAARLFLYGVGHDPEVWLGQSVAGAKVGFYGPDEWAAAFHELPRLQGLTNLKVDDVKVQKQTGNEATVEVSLGEQGTIGNPDVVSLQLRREPKIANQPGLATYAGGWRVVPPPVDDVLAKPLYETPPLQLAAVLATHDPRLLPAIRQYRGLTQLKQLGLGALQLSQDYNETFAFDDAAHERALRPYLKTDSLYTIAGTKDDKWHFNDNLSTLALAQLNEPARTVLFYDGSAPGSDHLNFRFSDKTLIGFADGHCQALSKDELKNLIWKP